MSKGRRYEGGEPKLNMKKVFATLLVLAVIVMIVVLLVRLPKIKDKVETKNIANSYIAVFTNNKWGVINSKGEIVVNPEYDEMITIPDDTKAVFICQDNVNQENGTYNSYAIDNKGKKLYTEYDKVEAIQNVDNQGVVFYGSNVLKVQKNGLYGLINLNGRELLEPTYTDIKPLGGVTNSLVTTKDGKKGLVDNSGSIIIDNLYADIKPLTDEYADGYIVKNDSSKFGLINYNKKQILECKYNEIKNIAGSDMYVVLEGQDLELISADGKVLLKNKFDEAISIDNSNVVVKNAGKYGVISSSGETVINIEYEDLSFAFDGNYVAKKDGKYGIINTLGETKLDFNYNKINYLKEEGIIEAERSVSETDLIDSNFAIKTTGILSEINSKLGYIKVRVGGDYKYYNYKLEEKDVKSVLSANTLFLSKKDGKYGFVDKDGNVIVDYIYDDATEQNIYGFAAINKNGSWGAIDSSGKVIIQPVYELSQNPVISFINKWHLAPDLNANYYTDENE